MFTRIFSPFCCELLGINNFSGNIKQRNNMNKDTDWWVYIYSTVSSSLCFCPCCIFQ